MKGKGDYMPNFELLDKAVKLAESGFTAEQINKIIDEDIKRATPPEDKPEDKKPEDKPEDKKPEDKKFEDKPEDKKPEDKPEDENAKRVKELEEQLKVAQAQARRTGDNNPEDTEKKAYDTLLSKIKNY